MFWVYRTLLYRPQKLSGIIPQVSWNQTCSRRKIQCSDKECLFKHICYSFSHLLPTSKHGWAYLCTTLVACSSTYLCPFEELTRCLFVARWNNMNQMLLIVFHCLNSYLFKQASLARSWQPTCTWDDLALVVAFAFLTRIRAELFRE